MKKILSTLALVAISATYAQVTIAGGSSTIPTPEATLDVRALNNGTTPDGILIPRIKKQAAEDMTNVVETTLVWIWGDPTPYGPKTVDVDTKGFYYFDGNKWVKVGADAGKKLNDITGDIRTVTHISINEWAVPNTFALIQTGDTAIELPDPSNYTNRIISVNNQYTNTINYGVNNPSNVSSLFSGKAHLLMSDGNRWYVIGGSY